jgi:hypothetical protein
MLEHASHWKVDPGLFQPQVVVSRRKVEERLEEHKEPGPYIVSRVLPDAGGVEPVSHVKDGVPHP